MFNSGVLVKNDTIVVLYACVLLVRHLHLSVCKSVDLVFDQKIIVVVSLIIEEGRLDLGACRVNQFDIEQTAVASLIFPSLFLVLLCDASFYLPIEKKRV